MGNHKNRRSQKPKGRSIETRNMLLDPRGGLRGRVPSGTQYKRAPKHRNRGWSED